MTRSDLKRLLDDRTQIHAHAGTAAVLEKK